MGWTLENTLGFMPYPIEGGGVGSLLHNVFLPSLDSYAHRTSVRKQLAASDEWTIQCLPKILPLLASQVGNLPQ